LRWLADENFNNDILRALFRRNPGIDVVRAQDAGLTSADDEALLAWAAVAPAGCDGIDPKLEI
jgi:hypothetical protein